jgi:dihydrofolate reductase
MSGINLIFASTHDLIIGDGNSLPWKSTMDLKHFKKITTNGVVIMGRKTYESIGGPLPNRINIVVSKSLEWEEVPKSLLVNSLEKAIEAAKTYDKEIFIIGGSQIYEQSFPIADKLYATWVFPNNGQTLEGDKYLVGYEPTDWKIDTLSYSVDIDLVLKFVTYKRNTDGNN